MQPKINWSVTTSDGIKATSESNYSNPIQEITITGRGADERTARKVCENLEMTFLEGSESLFGYTFKAKCNENTSCFFWAGGKAV